MNSTQIPTQQSGVGTSKSHALNQGSTDNELYARAVEARNAEKHKLSHSQIWRYIHKFRARQADLAGMDVTDPFLMGLLGYADRTGNTATQNAAADHQAPRIVLGLPENATREQIEAAYTKKLRYIANHSKDARNLRRVNTAYKALIGGGAK